jgi:opacity protein-like surface antigen
MKTLLLSACAAALIATGASAASASDFVVRHDNAAGAIIRIDDVRPGYGWNNGGYGWNNGHGYRQHGMVSPRSIVRNLQRHDYRYISRPVLSGRFYQVKAINPRGHKVKLYIDAYSGRIVRVKA